MVDRLVVGCGQVGHLLVEELADRPGELLVLEENERHVTRLREAGTSAKQADLTDPETLRAEGGTVTTVLVAGEQPARNRDRVTAVRTAFPDALVVAYAGTDPSDDDLAHFRRVADEVVDPTRATAEFAVQRAGDEGHNLRQLRAAFRAVSDPLAIVTHDNPDPDAIASAVALRRVATALGVEAKICYYGEITHQENRAFVNLLGFDLTQLDGDTDLSEYGGFALVDHSRPGVNDQLPTETAVDIVIDHHPPRAPVDAAFVDLRSEVGATSTLLVQYLQAFGLDIDETVATGLLFGIRVDTDDFTREASTADFEAAATLAPRADFGTLERIESPSTSDDTFDTIASAIANRQRRGSVVTSSVGDLSDRDSLAQAAERLLELDGVAVTVVYGLKDGVIYISGRARGTELDLGETLRNAFDQIGSAGGHADMAGAQILVTDTTLDPTTDPDSDHGEDDGDGVDTSFAAADVAGDLEAFITGRFYEAFDSRPHHETAGLYSGPTADIDDMIL